MPKKILFIVVVILFLGIALYFGFKYASSNFLEKEEGMSFSREVVGEEYLVESPQVTQNEDGTTRVDWAIKTKCNYNEVEIQEEDYDKDKGGYWGGMVAQCDKVSEGFVCKVEYPANEFTKGEIYNLHAVSHWCDNKVEIMSPVVTFTKK